MKTRFFAAEDFSDRVSHHEWGWILAVGILDIVLGIVAFSIPVATSVGLTLVLAVLLAAAGILKLIEAVKLRRHSGSMPRFFQALVALVCGLLIFRYPAGGMMVVALALSFYFFTRAIAQWMALYTIREHIGWAWGWALLGSIATFLLGVYMIATFPYSAFWIPGVLVGIDLIITGSGLVGFAAAFHQVQKHHHAPLAM